ncbi:oligopeptide/dipeptide ABC transporter ATP-binding protein [Pseudovibrio sp. Tun.PSC04-5.I4]|uniref:ABC transporter ATP-binding protein n=1 Tax=Pseudovibrio sp. Tun.PSC04-5.I4 TaxID=1798213 RepID=UPI000888C89F|nr:oligopeptide/dipeptide ABC transporter ATP-binding protein [Pseudovibrio sp. Tun.PSC04-5.I4]SDQ12570.1 peptide/nickel transport system ATP-binding protein [Pseudovibrio sp. Tun.PSC04-5.I4]
MTNINIPDDALISVENLQMHFPLKKGFLGRNNGTVKAVDDVSFYIRKGETFGIVGESGSGKSTTARALLRAYEPTGGTIRFKDPDGVWHDLTNKSESEMRVLRRYMQMIFQDPYASLNPRMTLFQLVSEPLVNIGVTNRSELEDRVGYLLAKVGLRPENMVRYPHAFSGGQRQRIGIARALALNPTFIAADEAVSALDVSIAAQTINLLQDLQEQMGLTYLFITHDLSMVEHISDRIGVMYAGRLVEVADTASFFDRPLHPYSEALLSAIPIPDPKRARAKKRGLVKGEVADPANLPIGCAYASRCLHATEHCQMSNPELTETAEGRFVRCHHSADLTLQGANYEQ